VGAAIQIVNGLFAAYSIHDLMSAGIVDVTPARIHPQIMNALLTAVLAAGTGALLAVIVWLAALPPRQQAMRTPE
jgi:hypothetical protein